jgi:hypothetical protein
VLGTETQGFEGGSRKDFPGNRQQSVIQRASPVTAMMGLPPDYGYSSDAVEFACPSNRREEC